MSYLKLIQFTLQLYLESFKEASASLRRNWLLIPVTCVVYILYLKTAEFAQMGGGYGGGMLVGLIQVVLLTYYYMWLTIAVRGQKTSLKNIAQIDSGLFSLVINTAFILFLGKILFVLLAQSTGVSAFYYLIQFSILFICNALPEVIYIQLREGMHALKDAAQFTRENWIEWYVPQIIFLLPVIFIAGGGSIMLFASMNEFVPVTVFQYLVQIVFQFLSLPSFLSNGFVINIFTVIFINWAMLFRGILFEKLGSGTRRSRLYKSQGVTWH